MENQLPIYIDAAETKLDWDAHHKASIEDRLTALRPYLTGYLRDRFEAFLRDSKAKDENNRLGSVAELEFLEQKVFEEKKIVQVLEEARNLPHPLDPGEKIKNPDYRIAGELYEIKGIGTLTDKEKKFGKRTITDPLEKAGKQIQGSGYVTEKMIPCKTKQGIPVMVPEGKVIVQLKGENLLFSPEDLERHVYSGCPHDRNRSVKEVQFYHNNTLIKHFARDQEHRMQELDISKAPEKPSDLYEAIQKQVQIASGAADQEVINEYKQATQNLFQTEYKKLNLKPFTLTTSKMAIEILKHNNAEGTKIEPEKFRELGFKQVDLNYMIEQDHSKGLER